MKPPKLSLLLLTLPLLLILGLGAHCKNQTVHDILDCSASTVQSQIPSLLPAVIAIITSGGDNWQDQLTALGTLGSGLIDCVVEAALNYLQRTSASQPAGLKAALPSLYTPQQISQGVARAQSYLNTHLRR